MEERKISSFVKRIFRVARPFIVLMENIIFYFRIRRYKTHKKIIYAITPPPSLRNIGDHAQVVAIKKWFKENFNDYLVLEFDKSEVYKFIFSIKKIVSEEDLIFLHSGGNLGDRGIWSENARRLVIKNFPKNKIISLPQTIFFSNTSNGRKELEVTKNIYNNHRNLIIMARDRHSFMLAKKYFPKCKMLACPDFVLYLDSHHILVKKRKEKILLCLRKDPESIIDESFKNKIKECIRKLNYGYREYDTTINRDILKENRGKELQETLSLFGEHRAVVTDRLHGVVFSVITKTPCVVLKTVDHKLKESVKWFKVLNYVFFVDDYKDLSKMLSAALKINYLNEVNWREIYFDSLKSKIF